MDVYGAVVLVKESASGCLCLEVVYHEPWQERGAAIPLWRHYLYYDFHKHYRKLSETFHCFESDDRFYGLNFVDAKAAQAFMEALLRKSSKECVKSNQGTSLKSLLGLATRDKKGAAVKQLSVDDMSDPTDFQHLIHIGFNPLTGAFEPHNIPPEWAVFFEKAGLTQRDLQDRQTADCVAKFVNNNLVDATTNAVTSAATNAAANAESRTTGMTTTTATATAAETRQAPPAASLPEVPSDRASLMDSIRQSSVQGLKPVPTQPPSSAAPRQQPAGSDLMASMLAKALADRKQKTARGMLQWRLTVELENEGDDDNDW